MDELARLKQLAGVNQFTGYKEYNPGVSIEDRSQQAAEILETQREQGFAPGTPEWFDLWFKQTNGLNQTPTFRGRNK